MGVMGFLRGVVTGVVKNEIAARRQVRPSEQHDALIRARRQAKAEAGQRIEEVMRYLDWAKIHGTPEQVAAAQRLADQWRRYWNQL
jgi:hypothetical protein